MLTPSCSYFSSFFFFFNDTATTEIYTLSLHDALPISVQAEPLRAVQDRAGPGEPDSDGGHGEQRHDGRSEEHTSELQSRLHLVCRLLLEKKKKKYTQTDSLVSKTASPL